MCCQHECTLLSILVKRIGGCYLLERLQTNVCCKVFKAGRLLGRSKGRHGSPSRTTRNSVC